MIWSPILLLAHSNRNSEYEIELRHHFYKINCAQAAQSIGSVFDTLACRRQGLNGVNSTKIRNIEVSIEGLTALINDLKWQMPVTIKDGTEINPATLPSFNQDQFIRFLRDYNNVNASLYYKLYFNRLG